jgi:DNA-binding LacI/PurR family transcriptional regulator
LANVGVGTVSRVLNDHPSVKEETRAKVQIAIKELDYIPNPIARQLSVGRTLTIGIIQPYLTLPSYTERLRGVQDVLANSEYDLVIFSVDNPAQRNAYFGDLSYKMRVDGMLIVSLPPNDEQADNIIRSRIPAVLIDADHHQLCSVVADDTQGGRMATRYLVSLGHQKIGFLSDYLETPFHPAMYRRFVGYRSVLEEAGIPFNPDYFIEGEYGRSSARAMARTMLGLDDPPTAIFAASDTHAIGVLDAALEVGFKVPERLSVIGYDNIPDSEYSDLTTIDQNLYESGAKGAQVLLDLLGDRIRMPKKQFVSLELLERNTTGPAPKHC